MAGVDPSELRGGSGPTAERLREVILELELAQEHERELREEATTLLDGLRALTDARTPEEVFRRLLEVLGAPLGFDMAMVLRPTPDLATLIVETGTDPRFFGLRIPVGRALRRALDGAVTNHFDGAAIEEWRSLPDGLRSAIGSALCLPIQGTSGQALVAFTLRQPRGFQPRHERLARRFQPLVTQALRDAEGLLRLARAEGEARLMAKRLEAIIDGAHEAIIRLTSTGAVLSWNPAAAHIFRVPQQTALRESFLRLAVPEAGRDAFQSWILEADRRRDPVEAGSAWREVTLRRATGEVFAAECSLALGEEGEEPDSRIVTLFIRDLANAKHLEAELRQAQKLESVGRLASGIAHELNTPLQFVGDSIAFVRDGAGDLLQVLRAWEGLARAAAAGGASPDELTRTEQLAEAIDLPYLAEQVPLALARCADGVERMSTLVRAMKEFAHPDEKEKVPSDLNRAIATTLTIARNEYKYVAELDTDYGDLPPVSCHVSELNQAVLNLVVNAAHAIADVVQGTGTKGRIRVATSIEGRSVLIRVSDTGSGVPEPIRGRIFDPFFTTKEVGRGTGLGLSIVRSVVCDKHGGQVLLETQPGQGSTFTLVLPLDDAQ